MSNEMLESGINLLRSGRFDEAAEVFEMCIAGSIFPARAHTALGCLLGNGHNLQASVNFKKSLNLSSPGNWETWLGWPSMQEYETKRFCC